MDWGKWWRNKVTRLLFLLLSSAFISCNKEDVILEPTPTRMAIIPDLHKVNIIVDNQARCVIFESDSIVLHYQDKGICKSFDTEEYYLKDVVLRGKLYTPTYTIYNGDIRIPILQYIPDSINYIDVVLYDGCPWYSPNGNKVLQSIQFGNPSVEDWEEAMTRMTLKMFAESAKYDADGLRVTPLLLAAEMDVNQGVEWIAYCINLSMEIVTPQLQGKIGELLAMQSIDVYQLPLMTKEQFYTLD